MELEPDTDSMDLGHTYVGDTSIKKIFLKNTSSLSVRYRVTLEGQGRRGGREEEKQTFSTSLTYFFLAFVALQTLAPEISGMS